MCYRMSDHPKRLIRVDAVFNFYASAYVAACSKVCIRVMGSPGRAPLISVANHNDIAVVCTFLLVFSMYFSIVCVLRCFYKYFMFWPAIEMTPTHFPVKCRCRPRGQYLVKGSLNRRTGIANRKGISESQRHRSLT